MKENKESSNKKPQDLFQGLDLRKTENFAAVYDHFSTKIWRHIYLRTSSPEDANDLINEVFAKTWEYLCSGKHIKQIKPFLYKTANNLIIDWYRARRRVVDLRLELNSEEHENLLVQEDQTKSLLANLATQQSVSQALAKVSSKERELLILRFVDELEISEIAAVLSKTRGATAVALHRALKTFEKILRNNGEV